MRRRLWHTTLCSHHYLFLSVSTLQTIIPETFSFRKLVALSRVFCLPVYFGRFPCTFSASFRPISEDREVGNDANVNKLTMHVPRTSNEDYKTSWRRILLLILAVTMHNIPEVCIFSIYYYELIQGLAVGVGFASAGQTEHATFETAFNLAVGIGLQNFPEGLAVSLPLAAFGHSKLKVSLSCLPQTSWVIKSLRIGASHECISMEPNSLSFLKFSHLFLLFLLAK